MDSKIRKGRNQVILHISILSRPIENKSIKNKQLPGKYPSMGLVHIFAMAIQIVVIVWILWCMRPPEKLCS